MNYFRVGTERLFDNGLYSIREKRRPPHWLLKYYHTDSTGETVELKAVLQKGHKRTARKYRWQLLLPGGGLKMFSGRRRALSWFADHVDELHLALQQANAEPDKPADSPS